MAALEAPTEVVDEPAAAVVQLWALEVVRHAEPTPCTCTDRTPRRHTHHESAEALEVAEALREVHPSRS